MPDYPPDYCRRCDVFIGYGGAGVARPPEDRDRDIAWLVDHCWVCGRHRDEIAGGRNPTSGWRLDELA